MAVNIILWKNGVLNISPGKPDGGLVLGTAATKLAAEKALNSTARKSRYGDWLVPSEYDNGEVYYVEALKFKDRLLDALEAV